MKSKIKILSDGQRQSEEGFWPTMRMKGGERFPHNNQLLMAKTKTFTLIIGGKTMSRERKVESKFENGVQSITFLDGEAILGELKIEVATELPESIKANLLGFACKQKVTNATGGMTPAEAYAEGKKIFEDLKAGKVTAEREKVGKEAKEDAKVLKKIKNADFKAKVRAMMLEEIAKQEAEAKGE